MKVRIPKFDILRILTYPVVFNPFAWLMMFFYTIYIILFGLFRIKTIVGKKYLVADFTQLKQYLRDYLSVLIIIFINTYWFHKAIARNYAELWVTKLIPYYHKTHEQDQKIIERKKTQIRYYKQKLDKPV